jgi:transposase
VFALSSSQRYFLYTGVADMRKSFDGLSGLVRQHMGCDPLSGDVYIFLNRRRTQIRLLVWDRSGFALYAKRLEGGRFEFPVAGGGAGSRSMRWDELVMILEGVSLRSVRRLKRFALPGK